jgi:KaiC/GvpD/RAD55 family RecA-like ATPase
MGIPVEVPGLDTIIPEIPDGQLIVVESGTDPAKNYFIRTLCRAAHNQGRPVTFVTSRDKEELAQAFRPGTDASSVTTSPVEVVERDSIRSLDEFVGQDRTLAVDSFSFLTLDLPPSELAQLLRNVHAMCHGQGMTALLATDRGMFDPRGEAVTIHLADGMFQFHAKEGPEGLMRFLRIPKWMDGRFVDRNIYYDYDGQRMAIDLRRRVI